MTTTTISCLCGSSRQTVTLLRPNCWADDVVLCHCRTCRRLTGQVCVSYVGIISQAPAPSSLANEGGGLLLQTYSYKHPSSSSNPVGVGTGGGANARTTTMRSMTNYYCGICGCHVFRRSHGGGGGGGEEDHGESEEWEVATGVVVDSPDIGEGEVMMGWRHEGVSNTKTGDGGLAVWLGGGGAERGGGGENTRVAGAPSQSQQQPNLGSDSERAVNDNTLKASCHCGLVSFLITRPHPILSTAPRSNLPDLTHPYHSTPQSVISNPDDVKWWLRSPIPPTPSPSHQPDQPPFPKHYLSGTCACRSCRLASGFEIQSWAFIPRSNILILVKPPNKPLPSSSPAAPGGAERDPVPVTLTFPSEQHLPHLKSYESSPGVVREFCGGCGATVFWHDKYRPDLIDVSVGLFGGDGGDARHKDWLAWHRDRVSFAEDVDLDRSGGCAVWARKLVSELEKGLKGGE